jgi:hypothetical protein
LLLQNSLNSLSSFYPLGRKANITDLGALYHYQDVYVGMQPTEDQQLLGTDKHLLNEVIEDMF